MYSDALKQQVKETLPHLEPVLDKMGENSRDMVNSMSDIVWAINPNNDDGNKLIQRMESYARDLCSMKNILLQFNADESIGTMNLPLEYRKNIYLIFKESLNNALKYSGAKQIQITLSRQQGKFSMNIEDNGAGFDIKTANNGNGLINIVERAKEIKGQSLIDSAVGKGTLVKFSCPLP
jgi:signal transduction histidine kinase